MNSKSFFKLFISTAIILNIGCGIKLGEQNKTANVAEVKGVSCLDNAVSDLKLFFTGDATDEQVGSAAECLQKVVLTFKDNIRGKDKNSYTPDELSHFLTTNFLKGSSGFSPELLAQIFKFKVLLFGGTEDVLQKTEIEALSSFIARLKPELVRLNPHMKVIVSAWTPDADASASEATFQGAQRAFNDFLMVIGKYAASTDRSYETDDLINLAKEVIKYTGATEKTITMIENLKLFILKTKVILIGGTSALQGAEWVTFTHTLSELFFQTLRIKYFITPLTPEQDSEKWVAYQHIADDITNLIPELMEAKGSALLTNAEITELIGSAQALAPDLVINAELVNQIGKLKLVLLGKYENGSEAWSRVDFISLNRKLPTLFSELSSLVKNFKYLKVNTTAFRKNEIKREDFLLAEKAVNDTIKSLSEQIKYGYDLADLKLLVINAKSLLKNAITLPDDLEPIFNLIGTAKYTLTGEPGSALTIANIQLLLNVGVQGYGNYVEFSNFVNPFKLEEPEFVAGLETWVAKLKNTLTLEITLKASHVLLTKEITPVLLAAQNGKFLTTTFQKASLDLLFDTLWANVLNNPADRLNKVSLPGFNAQALQNLVVEAVLWIADQKAITSIFTAKPELSKEELQALLKAGLDAAKSPLAQESLSEIVRLLSAPGLMNFNDKGYLKILTQTPPLNGLYHVADMSNSNLARALARIVIRSFANEQSRVDALTGVTLEEIQYGFDQLKYVLYDLDLIDPASKTFISGRFRESNLFLAPSNGDDYSSLEELHHLVLHILSGVKRADALKVIALQKCVKVKNEEVFAKTEFDSDCLLDLYLNEDAAFADMPEFLRLKTAKNEAGEPKYKPEDNKTYYLSLLKAAGHIPNSNNTVFLGDANLFPHVVQYIEMIYYTHDKNRDGVLQKEEALGAFPIFKSLIQLLAKPFTAVKEDDLPGVFIYLLKFGKPPKSLADKLKFAAFVKDHVCKDTDGAPLPCQKDWDIQSNRHDLGRIFNFIADATAAPVPAPTPTPTPAPPAADPAQPEPQPSPAPTPAPVNP